MANAIEFCCSSACGVSVEHMNAKEPKIRSIYISLSCLLSYQKNIKNTRNSTAI